jgi:Mg/Co/Ni transporter MgtE
MKSMVLRIREFFNRRTKAVDAYKEANVTRRTLVIENGQVAGRLMRNEDFALMFNLYRFNMLERLEDSKDDQERIGNAYYVAGVRDFIDFIEKQEYLAKLANKA